MTINTAATERALTKLAFGREALAHDALDMLNARTTQWITVQKSKPSQVVSVGVPVVN